jgi:hypothetical protein
MVKEGNHGTNMVHTCVNGKMISVEVIPRMGAGKIKENSGGSKFNYDIFDIL